MKITSPDFEEGGMMPRETTCEGRDESPELHISGVPEGTKSLALICDDPDAPGGTFVHWLVWNIPPDTKKIERGKEPKGILGVNGFGGRGYRGPSPPSGTHRYFFRLFALSEALSLREGSKKQALKEAMDPYIIAKAELMGKYRRG
ncbi:MAG: YbhB/YbcL family Raf kinase inhibitor-like protein [Thermodesulfobacteriota bacterium]